MKTKILRVHGNTCALFLIFSQEVKYMQRKIYRAFLFVLLTAVCGIIFFRVKNLNDVNPLDRSVPASDINDSSAHVNMVIPSGEPIGIYVKSEGVMVINTSPILGADGNEYEPCEKLICSGDYIVEIDGEQVEDKRELIDLISNSSGKTLNVTIIRNSEEIIVSVTPIKSKTGQYMLGLWVKDDISGIGTLTYIDQTGFGALGHSINDCDTGKIFDISDGAIYEATVVNIVKSNGEQPGRLEGMIDYSNSNIIGRVEENCQYGIRGYLTDKGLRELSQDNWMPVAEKEEVHLGEAYLLSWVSGTPEYYKVDITDIDISANSGNKGIELKVRDDRLIKITDGIVQGMSGTPIIQDGKLIGAVTHVFLKDATRGYGTFVEDMMEH